MVVIALGGAFYYRSSTTSTPSAETPVETEVSTTTTTTTEATTTESAPEAVSAAAFKSGVYSKKGAYTSPAGAEEVEVTLTLDGNTITDATFKGLATNPGSIKNQAKFSEGFKQEVVGKSIDTLALTVVNGSSLTPKGFMDAVNQIKTEARI